ncbi:MAG: dienelactone hydrolase family protein [Deltaproteobacteria bacterium]|nr:dienelactone hydrolase family protein [Deltaproteobacteria bacterium]
MKVSRTKVSFTSGTLELEACFSWPMHISPCPGVILCHPHPLYGGDMDNNVIAGVGTELETAGFAVLRFNFRGVHLSEGAYGDGDGEVVDVLAALSFIRSQPMIDAKRLFLAGYSFGAWVGLQAALRNCGLAAVAGIAPPLGVYDFEFLAGLSIPIIVVSGDRDDFCEKNKLDEMFNGLAVPKKRVVLAGCDHFYWGREGEVAAAVRAFFCLHL